MTYTKLVIMFQNSPVLHLEKKEIKKDARCARPKLQLLAITLTVGMKIVLFLWLSLNLALPSLTP